MSYIYPTGDQVKLHRRMVREACAKLGGEQVLAQRLKVGVRVIRMWIEGRAYPPDGVFLECLDVLEDGAGSAQAARGGPSP